MAQMENGKKTNTLYSTKKRNTEYIPKLRSRQGVPAEQDLHMWGDSRLDLREPGQQKPATPPKSAQGRSVTPAPAPAQHFPHLQGGARAGRVVLGWQRSLAPPAAAPVVGQKPPQALLWQSSHEEFSLYLCFLGAGVSQNGTRFLLET